MKRTHAVATHSNYLNATIIPDMKEDVKRLDIDDNEILNRDFFGDGALMKHSIDVQHLDCIPAKQEDISIEDVYIG